MFVKTYFPLKEFLDLKVHSDLRDCFHTLSLYYMFFPKKPNFSRAYKVFDSDLDTVYSK